MKNQALLVIVLLVVTGVGSYLLGSKLNPNKPRLIYIPGKNSSSIEKPSFLTKGSLTFTTGGKVKNKTTDSITIGDNNNEAVFKIDKNVSIFKRASESNEKSSSTSDKTKGFLFPEEKVSINNVKVGQTVSLIINLTEKEAIVKTIRVVN